jgi:hypothetical protein
MHMPELKDLVSQSWSTPVATTNKARVFHVQLARLARVLKRWSRETQAGLKREYREAQDLVLRLDQEQEQR